MLVIIPADKPNDMLVIIPDDKPTTLLLMTQQITQQHANYYFLSPMPDGMVSYYSSR